jgi:segregation and condensation protein A
MLTDNSYLVHLPQFEGPFDLLLYFIERDELDIYDIPISKITDDFLHYIHTLENLQIEVAAEFIAVAARLMKIKAAMLLPRYQPDANPDATDPRIELVDRLIEFKRYKAAQEPMQAMEWEQLMRYARGNYELKQLSTDEVEGIETLKPVSVYALFQAFKTVMERHTLQQQQPKHVIQAYPYTVEAVRTGLMDRITHEKKINFETLVTLKPEKIYLVFCFLSILELVQQHRIQVVIGEGYNNFWIMTLDESVA